MAMAFDTAQASALSRALRKAGWNPAPSDSARWYEAGLTVRRGVLGTGATVCLQSRQLERVVREGDDMAQTLGRLGYAFERSEVQTSGNDHTVWFRRVHKPGA